MKNFAPATQKLLHLSLLAMNTVSVVNGNIIWPFILLSEALAESFERMTLVSTVVLLVGLANKAGNRVYRPLVMFMTSRDWLNTFV